ncbi:MAG TPA: hypothetical protein VF188_18805 [Longimicrobiales bacterium]
MILALATILTVVVGLPPGDSLLRPDLAADPEEGPAVIVRHRPAQPLVAVRLSVPARAPAGAVSLLQELARAPFETGAAALGARATLARTPTHAIYSVVGPAEVYPEMVALLRRAVGPPDLSGVRLVPARHAADRALAAERDTPEPLVRHRLRQVLLPELPRAGAAATLTAGDVTRVWRRFFIPERMTAVVVGPMPPEEALAPFRGWQRPPEPSGVRRPPVAASADPAPQVVRPWIGLAYRTRAEPAVLAVTAALLARHLSLLALRSCTAEFWWNGERRALVIIASAEPPAEAAADSAAAAIPLAERLRAGLAEVAAALTPASVAIARRGLMHDMFVAARTPQGLAELIGDFHDRTGAADGAQEFLSDLVRVDARDVHRVLVSLDEVAPVVVEVRP